MRISNNGKLAAAPRVRYVPMASMTIRSGARIYIACPVSVYWTPRYERIAGTVRRQCPGTVILEARDLYTSRVAWLRGWPVTVRGLTHLVFFCDPDGFIGRGVWTEIADAAREGVTVLHVSDRGRFTPLAALHIGAPKEECWQRYCRVVLPKAER